MLSPSARLVPLTRPHTSLTPFTQLTSNGFSFSPHSFRLLPQIFENEAHDDYFCCGGGKRERGVCRPDGRCGGAAAQTASRGLHDAGWDGVRRKQRVHEGLRESHLRARSHSLYVRLTPTTTHTHTLLPLPHPPSSSPRLCTSSSFLFSQHV